MDSFEHDRDVIVTLPVQYARKVLRLMDKRSSPSQTPFELRPAVAAAQRCPDVARFFLEEKLRMQQVHALQIAESKGRKLCLVREL